MKRTSYFLVIVQVVSFVAVLVTGSPVAGNRFLFSIQIAGIVLGLWATVAMGSRNLNIMPMARRGSRLVTKGPYAVIRHPMYLAVLLVVWPVIIDTYTHFRLLVGILLSGDLVIKMFYEESILKRHFSGYEDYVGKTKRLIPYVF